MRAGWCRDHAGWLRCAFGQCDDPHRRPAADGDRSGDRQRSNADGDATMRDVTRALETAHFGRERAHSEVDAERERQRGWGYSD